MRILAVCRAVLLNGARENVFLIIALDRGLGLGGSGHIGDSACNESNPAKTSWLKAS